MNKGQFIESMAENTGIGIKETTNFLDSLLDIITRELIAEGAFSLTNFGSFKVSETSKGKSIRFSPAKALKEAFPDDEEPGEEEGGQDPSGEIDPIKEESAGDGKNKSRKSGRTWWDIYWV